MRKEQLLRRNYKIDAQDKEENKAMTSALTLINDSVIIDETTQSEAASLVREAGDFAMDGFVVTIDGKSHQVPENLSQLILHVIEHAAEGGALTVRTMPDELTTTVAADLLGVSRPTLMKLISSGSIPSRDVGSHKRLRTSDVFALKAQKAASQANAFEALRALNV